MITQSLIGLSSCILFHIYRQMKARERRMKNRNGNLKFNKSSSNPKPLKKHKYSPSTTPPLPKNPKILVKPSPIILISSSKGSNSIKEISKGSFTPSTTHEERLRKSSSWVKSKFLGKGGYGSVYLATCKDDNGKTERAIKSAKLSRASSLMEEGRILVRLHSLYIIRCYGYEIVSQGTDQQYNLILEYCSGHSLADFIKKYHGVGLLESDVKLFAKDILSGLLYIHDKNIIHCDIKPGNLLLSPAQYRSSGYLIKIGDFGLAMEKGSSEYGNGFGHERGTKRYMAPELIRDGIVNFSVDIWAFGCTVLEMLTGKKVWGEHGCNIDWVKLISHSDLIPAIPSWLSEEAQDFIRKCLVKEPRLRWNIDALMNHPFLKFAEESSQDGFVFD